MIARIVALLLAVAAIATATGVLVVSAAFALYALLRPELGPAGSAACVCLAAALLIGALALVLFVKARPRKGPAAGPFDKIASVVRDKPAVAAAAAAAAGLLAWRNPGVVSLALRFLEPRGKAKRS